MKLELLKDAMVMLFKATPQELREQADAIEKELAYHPGEEPAMTLIFTNGNKPEIEKPKKASTEAPIPKEPTAKGQTGALLNELRSARDYIGAGNLHYSTCTRAIDGVVALQRKLSWAAGFIDSCDGRNLSEEPDVFDERMAEIRKLLGD